MRLKRAQEAERLLSNTLLHEAVLAEEVRILDDMRKCSLSDKETHTRLVMALQMSSAVKRNLWTILQEGHQAVEKINVRGSRID